MISAHISFNIYRFNTWQNIYYSIMFQYDNNSSSLLIYILIIVFIRIDLIEDYIYNRSVLYGLFDFLHSPCLPSATAVDQLQRRNPVTTRCE